MRLVFGTLDELRAARTLVARVPERRPVLEFVVVLDGETPRGYVNRCEHIPVPLDAGSRRFLDPTGRYLECRTHGALFRVEDGYCESGPCLGRSLEARPIRVDGDLVVIDVE